jgi:drug/metabolite transporter (DMT)-like permease
VPAVLVGTLPPVADPPPADVAVGVGPLQCRIPTTILTPILAVLAGMSIAGYTLNDNYGVSGVSPPLFLFGIHLFTGVFGAPLCALYWSQVVECWRTYLVEVWVVAFGMSYCYLFILIAYGLSHVAYVAATREFGVLVGALLGVFVLKENAGIFKWMGIAAIMLGLVAIKLFAS